jgi:hypothetical protein
MFATLKNQSLFKKVLDSFLIPLATNFDFQQKIIEIS